MRSRVRLIAVGIVLAQLRQAPPLGAACNVVPLELATFPSTHGATTRPFAAPGEPMEIRRRPCDGPGGFLGAPSQHVVTIAFTPPGGGPSRLVMLGTDCTQVDEGSCGPSAVCQEVPTSSIALPGPGRLVFQFPNTDVEFAPDLDQRTLSGPAVIAVTPIAASLPCGLPAGCASVQGILGADLLACVDDFFEDDGDCGTTTPHPTFSHFTALPIPNSYNLDCFSEFPPCNPLATEVRFAIDAAGNLLQPVNWQGVLLTQTGPLVARLLRGHTRSPIALQIPDEVFLGSFSPEGLRLPPILEPQIDPTLPGPDLTLFGSTDAPYTIIRYARTHGTCAGGANAGQRCETAATCPGGSCVRSCVDAPATTCTSDGDCPAGSCGELFDLAALAAPGGPITVPRMAAGAGICQETAVACMADCGGDGPCVSYALEAQTPAVFECPVATDDLRSFWVNEAVGADDLNGDGDKVDAVVTLRNRETGATELLGAAAGCGLAGTPEGRAVLLANLPPFRLPAIAAEDDVIAFLEDEAAVGFNTTDTGCDQTSNGSHSDAVLRVYELGTGYLTPGSIAVDAAPVINGRSLAVSGGRVFFRASEAEGAQRLTERVSLDENDAEVNGGVTSPPAISGDGQVVAFGGIGGDFVAGGDPSGQVIVRDLAAGTTELASTGLGFVPRLNGDGRFVVFELSGGVFVRDRLLDTEQLIAVDTNSFDISADGRFIAFDSLDPGLVETPGQWDVFVRDRLTLAIERVDVPNGGGLAMGPSDASFRVSLSEDGRFVAFISPHTNLVPGDTNGDPDVFVRDRLLGITERVSVKNGGGEIATGAASGAVDISGDGRFVVFNSGAPDVVSDDTNGVADLFVHDRHTRETTRVSVGTGGIEANAATACNSGTTCTISDDGRFVAFFTSATNLVPGDTNGSPDVFVHDRLTAVTSRVSVASDGAEASPSAPGSNSVALSTDGRTIAFRSHAVDLAPGDIDAFSDIFVRQADPMDQLGLDALFDDDQLDDVVLQVFDTGTQTVTTLCPAGVVAVAGGNAAFLRPEAAAGGGGACPSGSRNHEPPSKPDTDTSDLVVHLSLAGAAPLNLQRAARSVSLSDTLLAALVEEAADGQTDYNDGHADDLVVQLHPVGPGAWTNTAQAADTLAVSGNVAAFLVPEAGQGFAVLNGDGDTADRVLRLWNAAGPGLLDTARAAEDFVLGDRTQTACGFRQLAAFRVREASQSNAAPPACDLNDDADCDDDVLHVYDVETQTTTNTGQAVTPTRVCDPEHPYEVDGSRVRFRTEEGDQNEDLDGNNVVGGLVVQVFDLCTGIVTPVGPLSPDGGNPVEDTDGSQIFRADAGRCGIDPPVACDPDLDIDPCPVGSFCSAATSRCTLLFPGTCLSGATDCPLGSVCVAEPVVLVGTTRDGDADGVPDDRDRCPGAHDPAQTDSDGDRVGDACDSAPLGCAPAPLNACRVPTVIRRSLLSIKDRTPDTRDQLTWKWLTGEETVLDDFGDPTVTESFALCLYDESGLPVLHAKAEVPPGGVCDESPCWRSAGTTAFKYKDRAGTPNGITKLLLKAGDDGSARVILKAKGDPLPAIELPLPLPLRVQLQSTSGACWEALYDAGGVSVNDGTSFSGRAGPP